MMLGSEKYKKTFTSASQFLAESSHSTIGFIHTVKVLLKFLTYFTKTLLFIGFSSTKLIHSATELNNSIAESMNPIAESFHSITESINSIVELKNPVKNTMDSIAELINSATEFFHSVKNIKYPLTIYIKPIVVNF